MQKNPTELSGWELLSQVVFAAIKATEAVKTDRENSTTRNTTVKGASYGAAVGRQMGYEQIGKCVGGIAGGILGSNAASYAAQAVLDECSYDVITKTCKKCHDSFKIRPYQGDRDTGYCPSCTDKKAIE